MYVAIAVLLVIAGAATAAVAQPYADTVTFIRMDDKDQIVEAVRNGTLDMYYFDIPRYMIEDAEGLKLYTVPAGGTLSLLLNPVEGERFNPFQLDQIRFAVHYLVDRDHIVDDLLGGDGAPMISAFAPHDPDYIRTLEQTESFAFRYDVDLAHSIISKAMTEYGGFMEEGVWFVDGEPVTVTVFVRDDDPVRHEIGDAFANQLEDAGFVVERTYGDLSMAYDAVYGSDPTQMGWNVYTEGWGGWFSKYDDSSLAYFYAPWAGSMPAGYQNERLDDLTWTLYEAQYTDSDHRTELVQEATTLGIQESVRVFLASKADTYVVNENVEGVVNHVASGVAQSFTLTNAQAPSGDLTVGVHLLSQSSWNPVAGFGDVYSLDIAGPLGIPSGVSHPHTGDTIPHAVQRQAVTAGPNGTLSVPSDTLRWNPYEQQWTEVGEGVEAITMVSMNYTFSNWHHGQAMDINDILYGVYFGYEWGTVTGEDDVTYDAEYTTPELPEETFVGIRPTSDTSAEVYINYWHVDPDMLAGSGIQWTGTPWELFYAMEQVVIDGHAEFSNTEAQANEVSWLSLIDADDTALVREYLASFLENESIPVSLTGMPSSYYTDRYEAAISWIDQNGHALIDNGPFVLVSHDDASGTAVLAAFRDDSYPYPQGIWSEFSDPAFPLVTGISVPIMEPGSVYSFEILTSDADTIRYFLSHETGGLVHSGELDATGLDTITIPGDATVDVEDCSLALRVFALSDTVIIPNVVKAEVDVDNCASIEEILEEMEVAGDIEFLKTLTGILDVAIDSGDLSIDDIVDIVDEEELSSATITLLALLLEGEVDQDDLIDYLKP